MAKHTHKKVSAQLFSFIDLFPDFYIDCSQSLTDSIKLFWFTEFLKVFWNKYELREKCSSTELFLVRIWTLFTQCMTSKEYGRVSVSSIYWYDIPVFLSSSLF